MAVIEAGLLQNNWLLLNMRSTLEKWMERRDVCFSADDRQDVRRGGRDACPTNESERIINREDVCCSVQDNCPTGQTMIQAKGLIDRQDSCLTAVNESNCQGAVRLGLLQKPVDEVVKWGRQYSIWPLPFGTACCAIEFMAAVSSVFDLSRFGAELVRFSPRQSDLLFVAGTVSYKQTPILKRIYEQMCEPKWVIAMGACASSGGFYNNYSTLQGIDLVIPVDVYIPGCPPRPDGILHAIVRLQEKIKKS